MLHWLIHAKFFVMNWILGADPGKHGGIVLFDAEDHSKHVHIPTKVKDDFIDVVDIVEKLNPYAESIKAAALEDVHAIFGSSASGTFNFGAAFGALKALLVMFSSLHGFPLYMVQPKAWQKIAWFGVDVIKNPALTSGGKPRMSKKGNPIMEVDTKATSMRAAHKLFSGVSFVPPRCRIEHDGLIDAALIGYYALVRLKTGSDPSAPVRRPRRRKKPCSLKA